MTQIDGICHTVHRARSLTETNHGFVVVWCDGRASSRPERWTLAVLSFGCYQWSYGYSLLVTIHAWITAWQIQKAPRINMACMCRVVSVRSPRVSLCSHAQFFTRARIRRPSRHASRSNSVRRKRHRNMFALTTHDTFKKWVSTPSASRSVQVDLAPNTSRTSSSLSINSLTLSLQQS